MYLIFLGTLKISVCTIVYPLQNCIKYYRQKKKKKKKKAKNINMKANGLVMISLDQSVYTRA